MFDNYIDVYLKVPIKELIRRDPKNIQKIFFKKIKKGLDLKFNEPKKCKIKVIWNKKISPVSTKNKILDYLKLKKCI